jgi:hypothetical protein
VVRSPVVYVILGSADGGGSLGIVVTKIRFPQAACVIAGDVQRTPSQAESWRWLEYTVAERTGPLCGVHARAPPIIDEYFSSSSEMLMSRE